MEAQVQALEQALGKVTLEKLKLESILEEIEEVYGEAVKKMQFDHHQACPKVGEQPGLTVNMDLICAQFGITRQAHYQQMQREKQRQHAGEIILEMVRQVRRKHPRQGARKLLTRLQPMLVAEDLQIGRDRLFGLLRERRQASPTPQIDPGVLCTCPHVSAPPSCS